MQDYLQRGADRIRSLVSTICSVILGIQVLIVSYVVAGRYLFNSTPRWGEELALLCMVWFSLLSAVVAARDGKHIRIRVVAEALPSAVQRALRVIYSLLSIGFAFVLLFYGIELAKVTLPTALPGSGLSRAWLYIPLAISGLFLVVTIPLSIGRLYPVEEPVGREAE